MNLIREALSDSRSARGSAKRFALVLAVIFLGATSIILALAAYNGRAVDVALCGVATTLAGLCGHAYVGGKRAELNQPKEQKTS